MELDIRRIKAEAREITRRSLLARIYLTNITHTRMGGYNARPYSKELGLSEGFRTSEVKGIWRWWLRATLAGALWDLGKEPSGTAIGQMVNEILGSTASASKFTLMSSHVYSEAKETYGLTKVPRMSLILMKRKNESQDEFKTRLIEEKFLYPPGSLKIALSLYERAGEPLDQTTRGIALGTLLLAVLLQGVGAMTRRGFGHFQVEVKECADELREYSDRIKAINEARSKEEMQRGLEDLLCKVRQDAMQNLHHRNIPDRLYPRSSRLPPFPSLSSDSQIFRLRIVNVKTDNETTLLEKLGGVAMKAWWKGILGLDKRAVGGVLDSWILGLPREARGTGYARHSKAQGTKCAHQAVRRPSAIILAPMKKLQGSFLVAIYGFLSSDWPIKDLVWRSGSRTQALSSHCVEVENISTASHLLTTLSQISDVEMRERIKECVGQKGEARIECAFNIAFDLIERQLMGDPT